MRLLLALSLILLPLAAFAQAPVKYVAVGYGGRRISSMDGVRWENDQSWSEKAADDDNVLFNIAYGLGRYIAVGGAGKGRIVSSADGKDWKELESPKGRVATVVFGKPAAAAHGRFIAGHDAELIWSEDGETFHPGEKLPFEGSVHARRSACGDTEAGFMVVIIGDVDVWAEKKRVGWRATTTDGEKWSSHADHTPEARDVAYGNGHFVIVGPRGLIESSHDGQNWRKYETGVEDEFSRVIWTGKRFLVSGGGRLWSSPDGLVWSAEKTGAPGALALGRESDAAILGLGVSWGGNLWVTSDFVTWKKAEIQPGPSLESIASSQP